MISSVPKKTLITKYNVNANDGKVTLYMPDLSPVIATSVAHEMEMLRHKEPQVDVNFSCADGHAKIEVSSDNLAALALRTTQIMLRHVADLGEGTQHLYASNENIYDVLNQLKAHAQSQNSTHVVTAIDKLISTTKSIERE